MEFHHQVSCGMEYNKTHKDKKISVFHIIIPQTLPPLSTPTTGLRGLLRLLLEGEGGGEYSEPRLPALGPVVQKLVTQTVPALAAGDFEGRGRLLVLGDAVRSHRLPEGWPRRGVLEFLCAAEEFVSALGTHVDTYYRHTGLVSYSISFSLTWFEVIFVFLSRRPTAERHLVPRLVHCNG